MKRKVYYLNDQGSRWIILPEEKVPCHLPSGELIQRTALMYEQFGNYVATQISYKGKKRFYLPCDDGIIYIRPEWHL